MRFPSVAEAWSQARAAAGRFPLVLVAGVAAAAGAWPLVGSSEPESLRWLRVVLASLTGIPLLTVVALAAERWLRNAAFRLALGGAGLLVPLWFWALSTGWSVELLFTRFFHLALGLHLLVAFLPFAGLAGESGFWQYNRILFLRFLLSGLYSAVLFLGLALALVALDQLFELQVDGEAYGRLFFLISFVFNTWFFLGGVPSDPRGLAERQDYPAGLRVFTQFVLMPLVAVYLLILTAYLGRVLLTRTWPSGWIGWLVSGVSVAGTLALLLVHPLREREGHGWINAYGRWFFVLLLPSVAMLLTAILKRVGQYGFTERRYFLLVLALYLAAIAVWYAVTASRRIRLIPQLLALVAFGTLAGPWSAYAVSRRSQLDRLEGALARNGMMVDGQARAAAGPVSLADRGEISGALDYLIATHGAESVAGLFPAEGARTETGRRPASERTTAVMRSVGLDYVSRWQAGGLQDVYFNVAEDSTVLDLRGYTHLLEADLARPGSALIGGDSLTLRLDSASLIVTVARNGLELARIDLAAQLARLAGAGLGYGSPVPRDLMVIEATSERGAVRVLLRQLEGARGESGDRLRTARATLLLRFD